MKSVVIAHQTVIDGDAIGNDILGMYSCLKQEGYDVSVFADNYIGTFSSLKAERRKSLRAIQDSHTIVIYHHSIFWEGGREFLMNCKGKIIFKYHNITPPEFFKEYSSIHYEKCMKGIEQTKEFIQMFDTSVWASDSAFSGDDLKRRGLDENRITILPPFNQLELLDSIEPDYSLIQNLIMNNNNNILFLGRVAPNKGHFHLINIIREYYEIFGNHVHLWIVGPYDDSLQIYLAELNKYILENSFQNIITFTGKLPLNQIKSYYLACDEYLCMSEHEGFCVPIIEAQQMMLPVVTSGTSALYEILGEDQIVIPDFNYNFAASSLYTIYSDCRVRKFLQKKGYFNATTRFSKTIIEKNFLDLFKKISSGD